MDNSWVLQVKVTPKARENKIMGFDGEILKVRVTEAPEKGRANDAVISLLAKTLSLPRRDVTLISGESSRNKKFLLPNKVQDIIFSWIKNA
ncbi:hypothetical protein,hypothetical protein,conserved hypothetical protein,Uncharacterised ACR, YggU family COG1872 [Chlamydia serpentis]|uniref:UPF0235 protein C10C_0451 n=1 Tax=Chlamydia serpentis TaxID=1967782 RepID=A0A2R8FBJ7_9CHLA|nr:DUF167 family protein [Chlamydia serpentis]SPN73617.1 hypothetical protein,hypothetical protein,conserved hypothetical protein,Uncharacterised ACR, YggU family COG1872 [Chlamydia serpentis]